MFARMVPNAAIEFGTAYASDAAFVTGGERPHSEGPDSPFFICLPFARHVTGTFALIRRSTNSVESIFTSLAFTAAVFMRQIELQRSFPDWQ